MQKFKTIIRTIDKEEEFDTLVNNATEEGWIVTGREVVRGFGYGNHSFQETKLVAFLERLVRPGER